MKINFFCIGAQKAGTTSLYHYMKEHAEIALPNSKEAPFFHKETPAMEYDEFLEAEFTEEAAQKKRIGTITPHYMSFTGSAKKLYEYNPEAKLIAVLRDPVERAYSHYTMCVRRGFENRSFSEVVDDLLTPEKIQEGREFIFADTFTMEHEVKFPLVWGEYGRILNEYAKYFPAENILYITSEELKNNTKETVRKVFQFLGVDADFVPSSIDKVFHQGGKKTILPSLQVIKKSAFTKKLKKVIPLWLRKKILNPKLVWWYESKIVVKNDAKDDPFSKMDAGLLVKLLAHYQEDWKLDKELERLGEGWLKKWEYIRKQS